MKRTELQERVRESHGGLTELWSIKDALAHIAAWEIEAARIVKEIQSGAWKPQRMNQEMIDEFNRRAVESRRERSFPQVREEFDAAHAEMERIITSLPDEVDESTPTYKYIEGVTFKHFAHHAAQIQKFKNSDE